MRSSLLILSMFVLVAELAYAQAPASKPAAAVAPAPAPQPAPQLAEAMKPLMGTWKCTGKVLASDAGPERPIAGTMTAKADLEKFWYMVRYDQKKTKQSPAFSNIQAIGWAGDKLSSAAFDSRGGVTHATSGGWKDSAMVWEGAAQMGATKAGFRETYTQDKKTLLVKDEFQGKDGKWNTVVEMTCKK